MTFPGLLIVPGPSIFPANGARDLTLTASVRRSRFNASIGVGVPRDIAVSIGAVEYVVVDVEETNGADISGAAFQISLGTYDAPGEWRPADGVTHPTPSTARVSLLIGVSYRPPPLTYWVWVKVTDSPEVAPLRCGTSVVTII